MTFGSLFAGVGGMDLGLERAGMECRWQVEIDPFCRKVLEKHWPEVPKYGDIREVTGDELERVDLIAGGFPCQDVSFAGKRAGIDGVRSGLWSEFFRLICSLRPKYALVENVPGLLAPVEPGLPAPIGRVLGDLARIGYDCEWESIPASAFGAEHKRERVFIVAYPHSTRSQIWGDSRANGENEGIFGSRSGFAKRTTGPGLECCGASRWRGNVHGIPGRVDRITALGNAVVPQIAEWIGRRILEAAEVTA